MEFLVDVRIFDQPSAQPLLEAHRDYLLENFEAGRFLLFGAYPNGEGGMLIARADSRNALEAILALDPLRAGNCAKWTTTELKIAKAASEALLA